MNHTTFSRKGGRARSEAKTAANRAKATAFWNAVRTGEKPSPRRRRIPPTPEAIATLLVGYARENQIARLEVFGSIARGEAQPGSDVDLLVTFSVNPGSRFFTMETEMTALLGVPVHVLTRESVEQMTNPYRRESILADAREIYPNPNT